MAGSDFDLKGGRIGNADRSWAAAQDISVTGWIKTSDFILADMLETTVHNSPTATVRLEWRNLTDSGSWTILAATGQLKFGATNLVGGNPIIHTEEGITPTTPANHEDGRENEGTNARSVTLARNYHEEDQHSVSPADALDGKEYEFRIYDTTDAVVVGTLICTLTIVTTGADKLFEGAADGVASVLAQPNAVYVLAAASSGLGGVVGEVAPDRGLAGASDGLASVVGEAVLTLVLAGASEGLASVLAELQISGVQLFEGSSAGIASVVGQPTAVYVLAGASDGLASVLTAISRDRGLTGQSSGLASAIAALGRDVSLAGLSDGLTSILAALTVLAGGPGDVFLEGGSTGIAAVVGQFTYRDILVYVILALNQRSMSWEFKQRKATWDLES